MQKLAGHIIIFSRILFEGADEQSWRDLEPYNFLPDLFAGADEKVGGIRSHIIFRRIPFEGADDESWRYLEP